MIRKLLVFTALATATVAGTLAQIQRTVLVEEFTNASCPPCAAQNPAFNAFLNQNLAKTISIKYQTNWPGVDPMNAQTQTWVGPRVTYYSVQGVPYMKADGNYVGGSPSALTQAKVDTRLTQTTPVEIELEHRLSSDEDSVYITCTITSYDNLATGSYVAHIGLVEREIIFTSPPGTNGEKEFYDVMRRMYPSASGTALGTTLAKGFTQTITVAEPIPAYVYQKSQLGVVAFVQNNSGKEVLQAAWSGYTIPDVGVKEVIGLPTTMCDPSNVSVLASIGNLAGNAKLNNCEVAWQLDSDPVQTSSWSGNLKPLQTDLVPVTLPTAIAPGMHTLRVFVYAPNGGTDDFSFNDTVDLQFAVLPGVTQAPLAEDFSTTASLPVNFTAFDGNRDMVTWEYNAASSSTTSAGSAKMPFYSSPAGSVDELILPPVNATTLMPAGAKLTFMVAHATVKISTNKYSSDTLQVQMSRNCGDTWSTVWQKSGVSLSTGASTSQQYVPVAGQWRTETINIDSFTNEANLLIRFVGRSNYGNNVYVDKINLTGTTTATDPQAVSAIQLAPNPASTEARISTSGAIRSVELIDVTGARMQASWQLTGSSSAVLDLKTLANGIYLVRVTTEEGAGISRLEVMH